MQIVSIGGSIKSKGHSRAGVITEALAWQGRTPHVLIVPSAASSQEKYDKTVALNEAFFSSLGVNYAVLHKFGEKPTRTAVAHEIGRATLANVIGGNSPQMLRLMSQEEHGSGAVLADSIRDQKLTLAGISAGGIVAGKYMHSNPVPNPGAVEWDFTYLNGFSLLNAALGAHANKHDETPSGPRHDTRLENLTATLPQTVEWGITVDEGAALMINGDSSHVRLLGPDPKPDVHIIWHGQDDHGRSLPVGGNFALLSGIVNGVRTA